MNPLAMQILAYLGQGGGQGESPHMDPGITQTPQNLQAPGAMAGQYNPNAMPVGPEQPMMGPAPVPGHSGGGLMSMLMPMLKMGMMGGA